ncbi:MAG: hypothetical protein JOZ45_23220 [Acidobacteriaceae bacterium]|nr:hypothetical protein [Acidobacteriaceae bacterium]MBV9940013.1 hypothetical protein [Acidobacteriaceae bacterium]
MNENGAGFAEMLARRGLGLARVSGADVAANERQLSGYRQYLRDHPEEARRYGLRQPHQLSEGQIVLVAVENNAPAVYLFNEVLTTAERQDLKQFLSAAKPLPDIGGAARERSAAPPQPAALRSRAGESYLSFQDLQRRWVYTRQGLYKVIGRPDFPPPCFAVNRGRTRIWAASDLETYERQYPELLDEARKVFKVRGYLRTLRRVDKAKSRFSKAGARVTG